MTRPTGAGGRIPTGSGASRRRRSTGSAPRSGSSTTAAPRSTTGSPTASSTPAHNALDRHVAGGRAEQAALIYDSPVTGEVRRYTYRELRDEVARCAGALRRLGVGKGDRVIIYMPMIPEAVVAMLACARLGAIHSVVFGGFAANELASRIEDSKAKLVDLGLVRARAGARRRVQAAAGPRAGARRLAAGALHHRPAPAAHRGARRRPRRRTGTRRWRAPSRPTACRSPPPTRCTSSTPRARPGLPKGIVRDNGGHAVALKWSMEGIYGVAARGGLLGGVGHRLGRRPLLHRLRPAAARLHDDPLRGQAGRHARRRRVLARVRRPRRERALHRADRHPRDQARGPAGRARRGA